MRSNIVLKDAELAANETSSQESFVLLSSPNYMLLAVWGTLQSYSSERTIMCCPVVQVLGFAPASCKRGLSSSASGREGEHLALPRL